jgi:subtilisin family serine protease
VAIAGPFTAGRQKQFADAIGGLALQYGAGARVVPEGAPDAGTAMAHLLPLESPFSPEGAASSEDIVEWLGALVDMRPDIVLLDYGSTERGEGQEAMLRKLAEGGALLVAAGGNTGVPVYPAWHDIVLAVGGLEPSGLKADYSPYFSDVGKPDLYALGTVAGTPLEGLPDVPASNAKGTSFAALNVVMAATCVWALDRTMTSEQVAETLHATAAKVGRAKAPRRLDIAAALNAARARLVMRALLAGPLDEQGVAAASGLDTETARVLLDSLVERSLARREAGRYVGDTEALRRALKLSTGAAEPGPVA